MFSSSPYVGFMFYFSFGVSSCEWCEPIFFTIFLISLNQFFYYKSDTLLYLEIIKINIKISIILSPTDDQLCLCNSPPFGNLILIFLIIF